MPVISLLPSGRDTARLGAGSGPEWLEFYARPWAAIAGATLTQRPVARA